jgi:D-aminoacyl-tRNA deacylase
MRTIIQRISQASVEVEGARIAGIGRGLLALVGIEHHDTATQIAWTADKLANLRIFEDAQGKMNLSLLDLRQSDPAAGLLLIPNFTVAGDARKGRRPSFDQAMRPELAEPMFADLARQVAALGIPVQTGIFRAHMHVALVNDGPVTIILESLRVEPAT